MTSDTAARWRLAVIAVVTALFFFGVWSLPLQEPDEGRYGDIAASMARTGDWLTPRLNGIRYYEKPPFYFWLGAACVTLLGPTEEAVRLPSAFACLATVLLLMRWGRRAGGATAELLAGAFGGTLPLVALFAHMAMVDLVLMFLVTFALYAAWRGLIEAETRRAWIVAFWIACGFAMLTKGPVGVALPLASVMAILIVSRSWPGLCALFRPEGFLTFVVVTAPWFASMEAANPGYLRWFFLEQNYSRAVAGEVFNRNAPLWFYVPLILLCFAPWILLLPAESVADAKLRRFLSCSIAVPFLILSIAQSKLAYYLLPLGPPVALLAAMKVPRRLTVALTIASVFCFGLAGLTIYASTRTPEELNDRWGRRGVGPERKLKGRDFIADLQSQVPLALAVAAAAGIGAAIAAGLSRTQRPTEALLVAAFSLATLEFGAIAIGGRLPPLYTAQRIARRLESSARPSEPILLFEEYMTSIPYYLGRPVTLDEATFQMFGHQEFEGATLGNRPDRARAFFAANDTAIVVCRTADGERRIREWGTGTWSLLGREGRYSLWRHSKAPDESHLPAGR